MVYLGEIVAQGHFGLAFECEDQGVGVDKWIAIAVTTNPMAHAQKTVYGLAVQRGFQVGIQFRYFAQKRAVVIAQRVFNLIGDR